jgi:hypothetical protein
MECFAKPYAELSLDELYEILRVRVLVFALAPGHVTGKRVHEA